MQAVFSRLLLCCVISSQGACSLHYVGNDGVDYHVGLMMIKSQNSMCTVSTTIQTAGLTIDFTSDTGGLNVGYRSMSKARINPETLVVFEDGIDTHLDVRQYRTMHQRERANGENLSCP